MRRALAALAAMMLVVVPASAASAAPGGVEFSVDGGTTWTITPPASLFDPTFLFVPGDTVTEVLLVRSARSVPTIAMVVIDDAVVTDPLYATAIEVSADDGTGAGMPETRLAAVAACASVVPTRLLQPGDVLRIEFTIEVSPTLTAQQSQSAVAAFDLQLALSDDGVTTLPNGCPANVIVIPGLPGPGDDPGVTGAIALSGVDLVPPTIAAALAFTLGGLLLAVARRRRGEARDGA